MEKIKHLFDLDYHKELIETSIKNQYYFSLNYSFDDKLTEPPYKYPLFQQFYINEKEFDDDLVFKFFLSFTNEDNPSEGKDSKLFPNVTSGESIYWRNILERDDIPGLKEFIVKRKIFDYERYGKLDIKSVLAPSYIEYYDAYGNMYQITLPNLEKSFDNGEELLETFKKLLKNE